MTISTHKLGIDSAVTKFIPGSTSNHLLAVKFQLKTVKHEFMKNAQNRMCLNEDGIP